LALEGGLSVVSYPPLHLAIEAICSDQIAPPSSPPPKSSSWYLSVAAADCSATVRLLHARSNGNTQSVPSIRSGSDQVSSLQPKVSTASRSSCVRSIHSLDLPGTIALPSASYVTSAEENSVVGFSHDHTKHDDIPTKRQAREATRDAAKREKRAALFFRT
jgi:hypothetical protein